MKKADHLRELEAALHEFEGRIDTITREYRARLAVLHKICEDVENDIRAVKKGTFVPADPHQVIDLEDAQAFPGEGGNA